jgi:peptide deformylase
VSILGIRVLGSPILRQNTAPVQKFDAELQRLVDDMFETMYRAQGIGLAAPQVGRTERLAVVDVEEDPLVIINPEIVSLEGKEKGEEGCLSIPDLFGDVIRATTVTVRALDRSGAPFEVTASDLTARCLLHEIDHLNGRLFIDYLSMLRRRSILSRWEEMKSGYPDLIRDVSLEPESKPRDRQARNAARLSQGDDRHPRDSGNPESL